ncbi:MAG: transglycosylase family protein [Candidatus Nanopelagicales bacterium]
MRARRWLPVILTSVLAVPAVGAPASALATPTSAAPTAATAVSASATGTNGGGSGLAKRIDRARDWAAGKAARDSRACRSGNDYRASNALGSGAYLLSHRTWRSFGGRQFAKNAASAPRFAQDYVAWQVYRDSQWRELGCPTADWMQVVFDQARGRTLSHILIPGTHDSGANGIRDRAPCRPKVIAGASSVFAVGAEKNPCVAAALARAQDQGLGAQLRGGVRYLDIRVGVPADKVITHPRPPAKNPLKVPLVLQHNYVSQSVDKALSQVLRFADDHPREQIIFDIQHVDLTGDPAIDEYYLDALDGVLHQLRGREGGRTACQAAWSRHKFPVPDTKLGTEVPLRWAWGVDRNLLILVPDYMPKSGCFRSRDKAIASPWPNTDQPEVSKAANEDYLAERARRLKSGKCVAADGTHWCGLFVNQQQLTPSSSMWANCVFNNIGDTCSLRRLAELVNDDVARWLTKWTKRGDPTNIQIIDYYEHSAPLVVDRLIRLNWAGVPHAPGLG